MADTDNYYGDDAGTVDTQNTADVEQDHDQDSKGEGDDYGKTAIIPKDLCPDMKVGDEMVVKIVSEHEGDWEVAYAPEKGGKEDKTPEKETEPEEGSMASMY